VKPCSKRTNSASGAKWLKVAERLARSIVEKYGRKYQIIDGFIIEGSRTNKLLRASVIEPAGYIAWDYVIPVSDTGAVSIVGRKVMRDQLALGSSENPIPGPIRFDAGSNATGMNASLGPRAGAVESLDVGLSRGNAASLVAAPDVQVFELTATPLSAHAPIEVAGGYMAHGQTHFQKVKIEPEGTGAGQLALGNPDIWKSDRRPPTNVLFSFSLVHGAYPASVTLSSDVVDTRREIKVAGAPGLGLHIDTLWIEQYLGNGARCVYEEMVSFGGNEALPLGTYRSFPLSPFKGLTPDNLVLTNLTGIFDTSDFRYITPWAVGLPLVVSDERVVWRVLTRYQGSKQDPKEVQQLWRLLALDVEVVRDDEGFPQATVIRRRDFSALNFVNPDDRAKPYTYEDPNDPEGGYTDINTGPENGVYGWVPHTFGQPAVGAGATAVVPFVTIGLVREDELDPETGGSAINRRCGRWRNVVLNADGEFVELMEPHELADRYLVGLDVVTGLGSRRQLYFGGAMVNGEPLYINPHSANGTVVLNARTMQLSQFPGGNDGFGIPSAGIVIGIDARTFQQTSHLARNSVCWYGGNKVAFPAQLIAPDIPSLPGDGGTDGGGDPVGPPDSDIENVAPQPYLLATMDVTTGIMEVVGTFFTSAEVGSYIYGVVRLGDIDEEVEFYTASRQYYFTKPHMVQRWIPATDDRPEVTGIIMMAAYQMNPNPSPANNFGYEQRPGRGKISFDGGVTWISMFSSGTAGRSLWYAGSDIFRPEFGELWFSEPEEEA
jgi:hypothetical protein